jgi:hypothetical protein
MKKGQLVCGHCGQSGAVRRIPRRGFLAILAQTIGHYPWNCDFCDTAQGARATLVVLLLR